MTREEFHRDLDWPLAHTRHDIGRDTYVAPDGREISLAELAEDPNPSRAMLWVTAPIRVGEFRQMSPVQYDEGEG